MTTGSCAAKENLALLISAEIRRSRTLPSRVVLDTLSRVLAGEGAALRPLFAAARQGCLSCGPPPVLRSCHRVFLAPNRNQVAIEHVLDVTRVEHVKVIFFARPRSFTVRVPALCKRPSLSHRCRSVAEIVRMSSTSRGITGRFSMPSSVLDTLADAVRKSS